MNNDLWLNLPVRDLARSRAFFSQLGFTISDAHGQPHMVCLVVGDNKVIVNLFAEDLFKGMTSADVADVSGAAETMISLGASSPAEVDAMAASVEAAGGNVFAPPVDVQGWMYGCGFKDLDGHRWNVLYMDMSKLPGR